MTRSRAVGGPGTALLADDVETDSDTYAIHGVAIGSGDVTVGNSGVKKVWPEDELREAADSLRGKPLVKDHENSVDGVIGRVTKTTFEPGTGILYEAEVAEQFKEVAQKIADGLLDVSVRAYHAPTEELDEHDEIEDAKVVEDIAFDNLAVVPQGASPSNTAQFGEATAMSDSRADLSTAELEAALADVDPVDVDELGLYPIKVFGHVGLNDDFLDENTVDTLQDDLESHEAITAVFGEDRMDLALIVDSSSVGSNDDLNEHIIQALDETPWEVHEDWSWIDRADDDLGREVPTELAFHGTALDEIDEYVDTDDGSGDDPISDLVEWSESDHVESAADEYVGADEANSMDDDVSTLRSWIEADADDSSMSRRDAVSMDVSYDELAMINGLEINGTVMWDDNRMGVIDDFVREDESLMVEIGVVEREDGRFQRTGETVTVPIHEPDVGSDNMTSRLRLDEWSEAELQDVSVHSVDFSGARSAPWNEPSLEDFTDESWEDLSSDEQSDVASHFLVSKSGFPPETFGDLALPVVDSEGNLVLNALQNAKARANQVSGLSGDDLDRVENTIDRLANENFEDADFGSDGDGEESEQRDPGGTGSETDTATIARITDESSEADKTGTMGSGTTETANTTMDITYHDVDGDELGDEYVAVEQTEIDRVVEEAERADELSNRLDDLNSTLDELSERTEIVDEVDDEDLESLREHDDPVVLGSDEHDAKMAQVDEIGQIFAELLEEAGSPFGAEELSERFSPIELKAKYEEQYVDDDGSLVDQLSEHDPEPEGEDVEPEELDGGGDGDSPDVSKEEAREYLATHFEREGYDTQAEQVRSGEIPVSEYEDELGVSFDE